MSAVFKKMNLKEDMTEIVVLNAPDSFEATLSELEGVTVQRKTADLTTLQYGLAFVITQSQVDEAAKALTSVAQGDALIWMAYPKKSSKKYKSEINRDSGWAAMGAAGYEPVRQVAIDADWSALRFRHVDYIKSLKRRNSMALSKKGKERTAGQ